MNRKSGSGGYDARDPKSDGNKSAEGKTDPKKGQYNDMYSREGQKNKPHVQYQNPQSKKFSVAAKTTFFMHLCA